MPRSLSYLLGVLLIVAGVLVDSFLGQDGGWRALRAVLVGAGAATIVVTGQAQWRARRAPDAGGTSGRHGSTGR